MHKSQAFGSLRGRGSEVELIDYTKVKNQKRYNGWGYTSWDRVKPNDALKAY
ncbi:MAG: hypothetical protein Ct9H90mP3_0600 [Flammeovirgaceae bacterium]|nr:MAG: hypothetical protein Ct9H90mP3_0600 [Flammeovirgaceae bacterium]